jgi:hypothetical protein
MDAEEGEFSRMDDHLSAVRCADLESAPNADLTDSQLEFGFVTNERLPPGHPDVPMRSRRQRRPEMPGRDLRVGVVRPAEELQLERAVSGYLPPGKSLSLCLTDNRYTIISVQRRRDGYRVRAHRMFAGIEPRLVRAFARYVVHNDQRASKLLGEFIDRNQHRISTAPARTRQIVLRTCGRHHDLSAVYERLNRDYFDGALDARISWGIARRPAQRRSIKVGSFSVEDRLIRVHPLLDHESVPRYFLDWIVFHEMLHGKHPIRKVDGRRCFHPPEFTEDERRFPDYDRARQWEKTHLDSLLG